MFTRSLPLFAFLVLNSAAGIYARAAPLTAVHRGADAYRIWRAAAIHALIQRGNQNSLATAAILRAEPIDGKATPKTTASAATADPTALSLASRASDMAPDDTAIGWIRLRVCALTPLCDIRGAATELRWLDPDNAAAWLPTLAAAQKEQDAMEIDRVLRHMAEGTRVDFYWNHVVVLMFDALRAVSKSLPGSFADSDATRLAFVERIAGAEILVHFSTLVDACRDSKTGTERRASCVTVARILRNSDTISAQLIGIALERRFAPADGKDARALAERRRVLEWRRRSAAQFDRPLLPWLRSAHARWRLAHMRTLRRQEDVNVAILRERGVPLDPPPPPPPPPQPPPPPEPLHMQLP